MTRVTDGLFRHATRAPDRPALAIAREVRCYGELGAAVRAVGAAIADAGNGPEVTTGQRGSVSTPTIGLLSANRSEFLEIFLGTALVGGRTLVFDPAWPIATLRAEFARTPPDLLFAEPERVEALGDIAGTTRLVTLGPEFAAWRGHVFSAGGRETAAIDDRPFYVGFTSGTTGRPKAFVRTHDSWLRSFAASAQEFAIGAGDIVLAPGPLAHSLTLYAAVEALAQGATVDLLPRFDAVAALDRLRQASATVLVAVPTMLKTIADAASADDAGADFAALRLVISSGAKLSPVLLDRLVALFPRAEIVEYYGASELSFVALRSSRAGAPPDSVGRPFRGVELSIRRPDSGEAAAGEVGLLWVRSGMICTGYLAPVDDTGFRTHDGWATVGDCAWRDAAGWLYLAGREQDMIITGGLNVYPAEVEAVLRTLRGVIEAAVFGVADPDWGERVCAVLVGPGAGHLRRDAVQAQCRTVLAPHKLPRRVLVAPALPLTPSGKLARAELRRQVSTADPTLVELE